MLHEPIGEGQSYVLTTAQVSDTDLVCACMAGASWELLNQEKVLLHLGSPALSRLGTIYSSRESKAVLVTLTFWVSLQSRQAPEQLG